MSKILDDYEKSEVRNPEVPVEEDNKALGVLVFTGQSSLCQSIPKLIHDLAGYDSVCQRSPPSELRI